MTDKPFTILYVEDEDDIASTTISLAQDIRLILKHVKTAADFINELKTNGNKYDGCIIDAKGYENVAKMEEDINLNKIGKDSVNTDFAGFGKIMQEIKDLDDPKPYVILTGYISEIETDFRLNYDDKYKFSKDQPEEAFICLKNQIINLPITIIKKKNKRVFEALDAGVLNEENSKSFVHLLSNDDFPETEIRGKMNEIRTILENLVKKVILRFDNKYESYPPELAFKIHWLHGEYNPGGKNRRYNKDWDLIDDEDKIGDLASNNLLQLKNICVLGGSHDSPGVKTKYLYRSAINLLCHNIIWFKEELLS